MQKKSRLRTAADDTFNENLFSRLADGELEIKEDVVNFIFNSLKIDIFSDFDDNFDLEVTGTMPFVDLESKFGEISEEDLNQLNESAKDKNNFGAVSQNIESIMKDAGGLSDVEFNHHLVFTRDTIRLEAKATGGDQDHGEPDYDVVDENEKK